MATNSVENPMKDYAKLRKLIQQKCESEIATAIARRDRRLESIKIVRNIYAELDLAKRQVGDKLAQKHCPG